MLWLSRLGNALSREDRAGGVFTDVEPDPGSLDLTSGRQRHPGTTCAEVPGVSINSVRAAPRAPATRSRRPVALWVAVLTLVAGGLGACGATDEGRGSAAEEDETADSSVSVAEGIGPDFGDIEAPCGDGDATVEESEAGRGTDKLYIGTNSEKGSAIRQGLLRELYDASRAFADWCNEQGGIEGLQIEVVDLDGKLTEVPKMIATACTDVFAMVGGGTALDAGQFTGVDGQDFHKCKLIDVPAFVNNPEKALSNGFVAPVPNVPSVRSATFWQELAEDNPDAAKKAVMVYSEAFKYNNDQMKETMEASGFTVIDEIAYPLETTDMKPYAERLRSAGGEFVNFTGEPVNLGNFLKNLDESGIHPVVSAETSMYDPAVIETAAGRAQNLYLRTAAWPFEEAQDNPATQKYLDLLAALQEDDPDAKVSSLGVQSMSAWLLFTQAASQCGSEGDKVISRDCVMENLQDVHEWTGGGLHAETDPGANEPSPCVIGLTLDGDAFVRAFPKLGSDDDDGNGYLCRPDGIVDIPMGAEVDNKGVVDPSRSH